MVIYKITNLVNGKIYIGQTTNKHPEYRFSGHKADAKYRPTLPIHKAIKKYGESSFSFEVIKQCNDLNHLDKMEQFYIKHFNSLVPNGYNVDPGGCRRELLLGYAKKRVFSSEHRRKLFESACRRKHTQESKEKMRLAKLLNPPKSTCKVVIQRDLEGNIIDTFESAVAASKALHIERTDMGLICRGLKKPYKRNFTLEYKTQAGSKKD